MAVTPVLLVPAVLILLLCWVKAGGLGGGGGLPVLAVGVLESAGQPRRNFLEGVMVILGVLAPVASQAHLLSGRQLSDARTRALSLCAVCLHVPRPHIPHVCMSLGHTSHTFACPSAVSAIVNVLEALHPEISLEAAMRLAWMEWGVERLLADVTDALRGAAPGSGGSGGGGSGAGSPGGENGDGGSGADEAEGVFGVSLQGPPGALNVVWAIDAPGGAEAAAAALAAGAPIVALQQSGRPLAPTAGGAAEATAAAQQGLLALHTAAAQNPPAQNLRTPRVESPVPAPQTSTGSSMRMFALLGQDQQRSGQPGEQEDAGASPRRRCVVQ
eukprot:352103-Chlamydomonas_euryale.AAC.3